MILDDLSQEIRREIDTSVIWHIMSSYWEEQGWTLLKLPRLQDNRHAVDITLWLGEQGLKEHDDYYRNGAEFLFREAKDATLFILKWM